MLMLRTRTLARAALAALALAATPAAATTTQVISGNGRSFTLAAFGPAGQSFTATDTSLLSFGFQFNALNPNAANLPYTFQLVAGEGFGGQVLATRSFTLPTAINTRTNVWYDIDLTGTLLTAGQIYTAILSGSSTRNGLAMGPDVNIYTGAELAGDAYAGGRAIFTREVYANCARTGNCDLNFRMTAVTAAVPEPAAWAMMIAGVAMVGFALRRRTAAQGTATAG